MMEAEMFSVRLLQLPINEQQKAAMAEIRALMVDVCDRIEPLMPNGRTKALALTKLEEATMFAIKAASGHR